MPGTLHNKLKMANSTAQEFGEAGSSLATRPSKIESIQKLCCNSFFRKTILSKKKLLVAIHAVHNDSTKTEKSVVGKHSYICTEKLVNKNQTKYQTMEHKNKETKKVQC